MRARWQLRTDAARILSADGWSDGDIAKLFGWAIQTVQQRRPREPSAEMQIMESAWQLGMYVSLRAARAIQMVDAKSINDLRCKIPLIADTRGFGRATVNEIKAEIAYVEANEHED